MSLSNSKSKSIFCLILAIVFLLQIMNPIMLKGYSAAADIVVMGMVTNEKGKGVWNCDVTLEYNDDSIVTTKATTTNAYGNYSFTFDSIYSAELIGKSFKLIYTNYGVPGFKSERYGNFSSGENIYDLDVKEYGTSIIHVVDELGNPVPAGVPLWISYSSPTSAGSGWPWNAPSDGITPHHITDSNGNISIYMDAAWAYDGIAALGGFDTAYAAGEQEYGGVNQAYMVDPDGTNHATDLRYEPAGQGESGSTTVLGVSSWAGNTVEYTFKVKPLGKVSARALDSETGLPIDIEYYDAYTSSDFIKYWDNNEDTNTLSIYGYGMDQMTVVFNNPSDPSRDYLGYQSTSGSIQIIPWQTVTLDLSATKEVPGIIKGRVVDSLGQPVSDASVNLVWSQMAAFARSSTSYGNEILRTVKSDANGYFSFVSVVPTGDSQGYLVQATKPGYTICDHYDTYVSSGEEVEISDEFVIDIDIDPPYFDSYSSIEITDFGKNAVIIQFPNAVDNTAVTKYEVYSDGVLFLDTGYETGSYENNWYISGLSPATEYEFKLYAYDDAGNSSMEITEDEYKKSSLEVMFTTVDPYDSNSSVTHTSIDKNGINGYDYSKDLAISSDGQYSLFVSGSENLKIGYSSSYGDIYMFDRNTGVSAPIIQSYDGTDVSGGLYYPSISADGRYIVFECEIANIVENDDNNETDVVIFDRITSESRIISKTVYELGNDYSGNPFISADGRFVVFESDASNLIDDDSNGTRDIYMYDTLLDVMTRVSSNIDGSQLASNCYNPCISGNGKVVVYEKYENYKSSSYAFDTETNTTYLVSKDYVTAAPLRGYEPRVSYDGRYIVFYSTESTLVENDFNGKEDVFIYDMDTGSMQFVSVSSDGTQGNNYSYKPTISADGRYVAFKSYADNLISNDTNGCIDVFVKDMQTGTVQLISKNRIGEQGNSDSSYMEIPPEISADGRYVQYDSYSTNIAQFDFKSYNNKVFIFDRSSDTGSGAQIPDYTVPVGLSAKYGQSLSDVQLPYGFTWEDPLYTKVGNVGNNTFKVTYTPDDLLEYSLVTGIDVMIQVSKAIPDYYVPSDLAADYGLTLADIVLPAGFSWQNALTTSVGNAGTKQFMATYTPTDTLNYEIVTDIAVTVLINKIDPLYTIPTGLESEYLDTLADIILPTGFTWKDKLTTAVGNAGTKQFMATFTPDDTINYNTINDIAVSVIVNKLDPLYTVPTGLVAEYSDTLSEVALPSGFSWQDTGDTYVGNIGLNQFYVTYTPVDTINYNTIRDIQVQISVSKADPVYAVPTGLTAVYGYTLSDVVLPSGFTWQDVLDTSVGSAGINPFLVTYTPSDTDNYNVIRDISVNVNVSKVISRIEADTSGIQTVYNCNDTLDLKNLDVTVYYTDNTNVKVNYADFTAYGIKTIPYDGAKLDHNYDKVAVYLNNHSDEFALVINKMPTEFRIDGYPKGVIPKDSLFDLKTIVAEIQYSDYSHELIMWDDFESFGINVGHSYDRKDDRIDYKYVLRYSNFNQIFEFALMTIEPVTLIPVVRIIPVDESISFKRIGESSRLRVDIYPSDVSDTRLSFISRDNSIATVNEYGEISAVGYGTTEIMISSLGGNARASIKVYVGKEFFIVTTEIPEIVQGVPYYAKLTADYGKTPLTWMAEGLPDGLSIDSSTGVISGIAKSASPSMITAANVFNVTVTDANEEKSERSYSANVSKNRVKIMNVGNILPDAYVAEQYKTVIEARYGTVPYVFSATNLPQGLSINTATGVISGIPTQKADNIPVRVTVRQASGTDSWSHSITFILSIKDSDSILKIDMDSSDKGSSATINANDLISYNNKDKEIIIETDRASYNLPVGTISSDNVKNAFGPDVDFNDVEISIDVLDSDEDKIKFVENVKESGKFSIMVPPVDFNVTLKYNGKTVEIDKFNAYIERRILIPSDINPYSISTAIVVEPDGSLKHVPTRIEYVNGQYYAVIKSRTNSTYVLIDMQVAFQDIEGHDAQASILNLARRLIVNGVSADLFDPEGLVTRAQFSTMISRALGIAGISDSVQFTDVQRDSWYYEYIMSASAFNLVDGSRSKSFNPDGYVTVGQAAKTMDSSMTLTGNRLSVSLDEYNEYTDIYTDRDKISQSVLLSMARLKKAGIYFNYEDTETHANEFLTRAQAVMMIEQMLKASGLID